MAKNPLITLIQAQERQQGGALLLDVRSAEEHQEWQLAGWATAINRCCCFVAAAGVAKWLRRFYAAWVTTICTLCENKEYYMVGISLFA